VATSTDGEHPRPAKRLAVCHVQHDFRDAAATAACAATSSRAGCVNATGTTAATACVEANVNATNTSGR
jgi:hypothetical protein